MGLLADFLRFAVPMWEIEMADWPRASLPQIASQCATVVASQADCLMFKSRTRDGQKRTKETFNRMAQGLAIVNMLAKDFDLSAVLDNLDGHENEFFGDTAPSVVARDFAPPAQCVRAALQQLSLPLPEGQTPRR